MRRENFFAIKQHAITTTHDIHPNYVEINEKGVNNLRQRQFLESWHSEGDKNSINENIYLHSVAQLKNISRETNILPCMSLYGIKKIRSSPLLSLGYVLRMFLNFGQF